LAAIPAAVSVAWAGPKLVTAAPQGPFLQEGAVSPRARLPMLAADGSFPPAPPPPTPPPSRPDGRPDWDFSTLNSIVRSIRTQEPVAALTIDDGWAARSEMLDALARADVRATFFVIGRVLDENPDFVRRALDEGHEFGNHTYHHLDAPAALRQGTLLEQLRWSETALQRIAGDAWMKPYFRPPGGGCNADVVAAAAAEGYRTILWSVDPWDWKWPLAAGRVVPQTAAGSIVLNHFVNSTAANIGTVITQLREQKGLRFVTLTELFRSQSS
jgi:peptidoglycan-N-acetylglucosamine deacetylase